MIDGDDAKIAFVKEDRIVKRLKSLEKKVSETIFLAKSV